MKRGQDKLGRVWKIPKTELCPVCGQPDNCGDCDHRKLPMADVVRLGGKNEAKSCPCDAINPTTWWAATGLCLCW